VLRLLQRLLPLLLLPLFALLSNPPLPPPALLLRLSPLPLPLL
jgi:hypothetical protein